MKQSKLIGLILTIGVLAVYSCKKKDTPTQSTTTTPPTPTTYSTYSIQIALVDKTGPSYTGFPGAFPSNAVARIRCNGTILDSLPNLAITTITTTAYTYACTNISMLTLNTKSFKIQDAATNWLEVWNPTTGVILSKSEIMRNSDYLNPYYINQNNDKPDNYGTTIGGCNILCALEW